MECEIRETTDGFQTLRVETGTESILLNSSANPLATAREWVEDQFPDPEVIILIGTDFLYPVQALLECSSLKKLYLIEYWEAVREATRSHSSRWSYLDDERVEPLFDRSIKEIIDFFRGKNVAENTLDVVRSPVSGHEFSANQKAYEILRDVVFQTLPEDIHHAIQQVLERDRPLKNGDRDAALLFMNELVHRFERKDIDYDLFE